MAGLEECFVVRHRHRTLPFYLNVLAVFGRYSNGLKRSDSLASPRNPASGGSLYVGQGIAIRQIVAQTSGLVSVSANMLVQQTADTRQNADRRVREHGPGGPRLPTRTARLKHVHRVFGM
jgi:hypothetical protein